MTIRGYPQNTYFPSNTCGVYRYDICRRVNTISVSPLQVRSMAPKAKSEGLGSQGPTPASLKQSRQHQSHSNQAAQQRRTKATGEKLLYSMDGRLPKRTKLSVVVSDAVRRWFLDTEMEAERGDVKAQALLGQMLIEGYGCEANPALGREFVEKARRRGYRMQGVYCEI